MKTKIIFAGLTALVLAVFTLSCVLNLGDRIDIEGPSVEFTAPAPRKAVTDQFTLEGTAQDNSAIRELLITASRNSGLTRDVFGKQWRYNGSKWEVSVNLGAWTELAGAVWDGDLSNATWSIPVDMRINDVSPEGGEYMFTIQAWDRGGFSSENSIKTLVLIYDVDPPKVEIIKPDHYSRFSGYNPVTDSFEDDSDEARELQSLHRLAPDGGGWRDPALLGKFLTQEFTLQWQIEDDHDISSIDIRFYGLDVVVDGYPDTPLPDTWFFKHEEGISPSPPGVKPNGFIEVDPNANTPNILMPLTKETIQIVGICYDGAGRVNQEKVLGYFIYWPEAAGAWVAFTDGMEKPEYYDDMTFEQFEEDAFMVYPERNIKATAYQAHGVSRVEFTMHSFTIGESPRDYSAPLSLAYIEQRNPNVNVEYVDATAKNKVVIRNTPRPSGDFSIIFPWDFMPPSRSSSYIVRAQAFDYNGTPGAFYEAVFRVQDITFPDFPEPPQPSAGEPLFRSINRNGAPANSIKISGEVADATAIESLYMTWINPQSAGYAAMSQLSYFRDSNYIGWLNAINNQNLQDGQYMLEDEFDTNHPNKVWKVALGSWRENEDHRHQYTFEQIVNLTTDLNIAGAAPQNQPLSSQVFLFRAQNPDGKSTIITYTPKGDVYAPEIRITDVHIQSGASEMVFLANVYNEIPQFKVGDIITINGEWGEDSTAFGEDGMPFLPKEIYFDPNFKVSINSIDVPHDNITINMDNPQEGKGTWKAEIIAKDGEVEFSAASLKDTLVISAEARDIGGNRSEAGASWLIQSDRLRLMRISSANPDRTYREGEKIEIFLEFSKPVRLKNFDQGNRPILHLNTGATATYMDKNTSQATRHFFEYTVSLGEMALSPNYLNVTGLNTTVSWETDNYPFIWSRTGEEIRITADPAHIGQDFTIEGNIFFVRNLPVTTVSTHNDYQFTLVAGKHIVIDTAAPHVTSITPNTLAGHYRTDAEIYITVNFDKPVRIGSPLPRLSLAVSNAGNTEVLTSDDTADVRVNNNSVTFKYVVKDRDTTSGSAIVVTGHQGVITDLAGTPLAANGISSHTLSALTVLTPGTSAVSSGRSLIGRYIHAMDPAAPTVKVLTASNINSVLSQTVSGSLQTGESMATGSTVALGNVYQTNLWLAVESKSPAAHELERMEYSINNGASWVRVPNNANTPFGISQPGAYNIIARQISPAGNISANSGQISFTWDAGNLISRIDSSTPNGTFSNNTNPSSINITVYFRKPLFFTGTPTITLNARTTPVTTTAQTNVSSLSFTYAIANGDNTPSGQPLNVTGISFNATDAASNGVDVSPLLTVANIPSNNNLGDRKNLIVQTGPLTAPDPAWATTQTDTQIRAADSWSGTITFTFNHSNVSKGTSGNVTIVQTSSEYRLPAVLTEAQSSRYRNARNFNTYYTRGTNGFINGSGSDTSTKFVLNYEESTVVTPNNTGTAIQQMAYDFLAAETVTLPVTSQDISVSGNTMTITLADSNALQVLGAQYTLSIPANIVQDSLGNTWPSSAYTNNHSTPLVNKSFVRVDKQINKDTVVRTSGAGSVTNPWLTAAHVVQTRARLDCRTPSSIVRYNATGRRYDARGQEGTAIGTTSDSNNNSNQTTSSNQWSNTEVAANRVDTLTQNDPEGNGTNYTIFTGIETAAEGPHIEVGDNTEHGYVWRITTKGRISANGTTSYSDISEEIAFRTVLTVQLDGMATTSLGAPPASGDQLWIRGGDAVSSSSVPGFPLTWSDDFNSLPTDGNRAGIRLLRRDSATTNFGNASQWKWVTWEVNVETYFNVVLGREAPTVTEPNATANEPDAAKAWQYGPRTWSYNRGGWASLVSVYRLFPGKHRWIRMNGNDYQPGGPINFSHTFTGRPDLAPTLTQP